MANKSGRIGREGENGVVAYYRQSGAWPHAEVRTLYGRYDQGDITGTPGVCTQVKAGEQAYKASDNDIDGWMVKLAEQTAHANADVGVLVLKRRGYGKPNAAEWWAYLDTHTLLCLTAGAEHSSQLPDQLGATPLRMHLRDAVTLLRWAGYGTPLHRTETCYDTV